MGTIKLSLLSLLGIVLTEVLMVNNSALDLMMLQSHCSVLGNDMSICQEGTVVHLHHLPDHINTLLPRFVIVDHGYTVQSRPIDLAQS